MVKIEMNKGCDGVWRAWALLSKLQLTQPTWYDTVLEGKGRVPDWFVNEWVVVACHKNRKKALRIAAKRVRRYA